MARVAQPANKASTPGEGAQRRRYFAICSETADLEIKSAGAAALRPLDLASRDTGARRELSSASSRRLIDSRNPDPVLSPPKCTGADADYDGSDHKKLVVL